MIEDVAAVKELAEIGANYEEYGLNVKAGTIFK